MRGLWTLIKKDLHLLMAGKFFVLAGFSLLLFSLYINYVFVDIDTAPPVVAVYDPLRDARGRIRATVSGTPEIMFVPSSNELYEVIKNGRADVGLSFSGKTLRVLQRDSDERNNALTAEYARAVLSGNNVFPAMTYIGENNRPMKNRRLITNEVLFFQISTVGFLGIASLLYKEKSMGVLRAFGIIPVRRGLFILSKSLTFLLSDLLFAAGLIVVNLGPGHFWAVFLRAFPHIVILSVVMGLLGLAFSLLFRDFKQYAVPFTFIVILIITPVFLAGNINLDWAWMQYYPVYHLFMGLKNAFFGQWTTSIPYYLAAVFTIGILAFWVWQRMKIELSRG